MSYINDLTSEYEWLRRGVEEKITWFDTEATVDLSGVVRWKSNKQVPPDDILELWAYKNKAFDIVESRKIREQEIGEFLKLYRQKSKDPSEEELFEARAAFGPGVVIQDIISGRRFTT